jgi:pyrroline-5-carboxylate reductase
MATSAQLAEAGSRLRIAFVGGGNMASALVGGLLQQGLAADRIAVVDPDAAAQARLTERYAVRAGADLGEALAGATLIVLAVKPQQMHEVARGLQPLLAGRLVVTIAAGIRTADLSAWLGGHGRVVRAMPNTPALVLAGVSALYAMSGVGPEDRAQAQAVLAAVGATMWVADEAMMDAVTAVSGSGPAYVFYFMEAMLQAAAELGLTSEQARELTVQTFQGAALLARQSSEGVDILRARVTSKGGTTERALKSLDGDAVKQSIVRAIRLAAERSRELGEALGKPPPPAQP